MCCSVCFARSPGAGCHRVFLEIARTLQCVIGMPLPCRGVLLQRRHMFLAIMWGHASELGGRGKLTSYENQFIACYVSRLEQSAPLHPCGLVDCEARFLLVHPKSIAHRYPSQSDGARRLNFLLAGSIWHPTWQALPSSWIPPYTAVHSSKWLLHLP